MTRLGVDTYIVRDPHLLDLALDMKMWLCLFKRSVVRGL